MKNDSTWNKLHKYYSNQDWIGKPNIFAEEVLEYLPNKGSILCLGDGQGQDGRFFASKGYEVTSTDISESAIEINKKKSEEEKLKNITISKLDLREKFPFYDENFDVVYAHLSLHYFSKNITEKIFDEIYRILKKGGILAVFTNSTSDPEYNTGKKIEDDLFEIEGMTKRFFSVETIKQYTSKFSSILVDNNGKTYKDEAKGVRNLIRFIGRKV
jgi:SAM-dependent methyltransferase